MGGPARQRAPEAPRLLRAAAPRARPSARALLSSERRAFGRPACQSRSACLSQLPAHAPRSQRTAQAARRDCTHTARRAGERRGVRHHLVMRADYFSAVDGDIHYSVERA